MSFSPLDIAGCVVWLDAGQIAGLSDGDPVATWNDASGEGNDLAQATEANQPEYKTGILNSLPVVRFNGSTSYLAHSGTPLSGSNPGFVLAAAKVDNDPPAGSTIAGALIQSDNNTSTGRSHHPFTDGNIYDSWGSTVRKLCGNPTPSLASWFLYGAVSAASRWECWVNGTSLFSTGTNTVAWDLFMLGVSVTDRFWDGDIAEVIVIQSSISDSDRQQAEGYLAHKYGITAVLPGDHPYKSSPPGAAGGRPRVNGSLVSGDFNRGSLIN